MYILNFDGKKLTNLTKTCPKYLKSNITCTASYTTARQKYFSNSAMWADIDNISTT